MTELISYIVMVCGGVIVVTGALFGLWKLRRTLWPIKIVPSINVNFDIKNTDSISAIVINRSVEPLYIIECFAQESKPISTAIVTHIKWPFLKRSRYSCVWWGSQTFKLLNEHQLKLEPGEVVEFKHRVDFNSPMTGFSEHEFRVKVKLSSGRTITSSRLDIPRSWHMLSV